MRPAHTYTHTCAILLLEKVLKTQSCFGFCVVTIPTAVSNMYANLAKCPYVLIADLLETIKARFGLTLTFNLTDF